jgi:hypothetical protein
MVSFYYNCLVIQRTLHKSLSIGPELKTFLRNCLSRVYHLLKYIVVLFGTWVPISEEPADSSGQKVEDFGTCLPRCTVLHNTLP